MSLGILGGFPSEIVAVFLIIDTCLSVYLNCNTLMCLVDVTAEKVALM